MDPRLRTVIWALVGLALAVGISLTAFAVAGGTIGEPMGSVRVFPQGESNPQHGGTSPGPDSFESPPAIGTSEGPSGPTGTFETPRPSPSEDHGGSEPSSDDSSGSGSDD